MKIRVLKPIIGVAFGAVAGAVVMLLWNAIIPSVIGWGALSYLQAVGLLLLCRVLFGRFPGIRERMVGNREELRAQLRGMSREQRQEHIRGYMKNEQ